MHFEEGLRGFNVLPCLRNMGFFSLLMKHTFIKYLLYTLNFPCLFVAEPDPDRVSDGVTPAGRGPGGIKHLTELRRNRSFPEREETKPEGRGGLIKAVRIQ